MDLLISKDGLKCGRDSIAMGNSRLKKALRLFWWFSEILPKKLWADFENDIIYALENESTNVTY